MRSWLWLKFNFHMQLVWWTDEQMDGWTRKNFKYLTGTGCKMRIIRENKTIYSRVARQIKDEMAIVSSQNITFIGSRGNTYSNILPLSKRNPPCPPHVIDAPPPWNSEKWFAPPPPIGENFEINFAPPPPLSLGGGGGGGGLDTMKWSSR